MEHDTHKSGEARRHAVSLDSEKTVAAYDEFEASCFDRYDYLGKSASCMDQTGLIPSRPQSEAELESYQDLYPFAPPLLESEDSAK